MRCWAGSEKPSWKRTSSIWISSPKSCEISSSPALCAFGSSTCCRWLRISTFYTPKDWKFISIRTPSGTPFNKTEHYFPVYFYEVICGHLVTAVPFTLFAFFLSMVGQLTVLFKCLGEDMATIVNEHKAAKRSKTVEKLNKAVDLHNQLFDMASRLFQIFETPLLVYVMTQASTLCFLAFICSVRKLNRSISSSSG